jgi:predicted PurR-regulated permease PerM
LQVFILPSRVSTFLRCSIAGHALFTAFKKAGTKRSSRGLSAFLCVFLLLLAIAGVLSLIFTQVAGIAEDAPKLKENIGNAINKVKEYISKAASASPAQQQEMIKQQQSGGAKAGAVVSSVLGSMAAYWLILF